MAMLHIAKPHFAMLYYHMMHFHLKCPLHHFRSAMATSSIFR
ncbi:hypothetical protein COLO4_32944 [Corchorus olitorius]|uniref:Uncharacterized protein n=1 Tax=Corchorus olitorius TaxID=93759 RepID=A0A1R3GXB3_9ROSI|nr:hypothetical protein COLO4_32944 [Corchorus olitorius]